MSAPLGNQFWKLRSKHGRDKLFATPELLWEAATEYFEWCDKNPVLIRNGITNDKSGKKMYENLQVTIRPYSLAGLCSYIGASHSFWLEFKKAEHQDFLDIIARIENIIDTQQFEGAVAGAFNANIVMRKLGLAEKQLIAGSDGGDIKVSHKIENHKVIFEHYTKDNA